MKKTSKSLLAFVLALCLVMTFPIASVFETVLPENIGIIEAQAATVKLNKTKLVLIKGQTETLKITGTSKKVKWSTSKKSVATVDSKGKVTSKAKGTAVISAKVSGKTYKCTVTVETPKISKTKANLTIFKTTTLSVSGTKQKITWKSSNTKVATVDSKGKVTAKKLGSATITATVGTKKKNYTCKITVVDTKKGQTFTKLKNALKKYGEIDEEGDLIFYYDFESGEEEHTAYVWMEGDLLCLSLVSIDDDEDEDSEWDIETFTSVKLKKYNNTANVYFDYEFNYYCEEYPELDEESYCVAKTSFDATKWNNKALKYSFTEMDDDGDGTFEDYAPDVANSHLKTLMKAARTLLNRYGISINDLGFTSYK